MIRLHDVFNDKGLLAKAFPNYAVRDGQVLMAKNVEEAISENSHAVIEAATGVGKSFGYLIPILINGKKAIVSTSNKNLQDQLATKDLPTLQKILGLPFTFTTLKGKSNYFCYEHFKVNHDEIFRELRKQDSKTGANVLIEDLAEWAATSKDGDMEYCDVPVNWKVKSLVVCDADTKHDKDTEEYDKCFAVQARKRAKESDIVLVNHTLLALDIALREQTDGLVKMLPDVDVHILDEAHAFEKYAVMAFSDEISLLSLYHLLNWGLVRKALSEQERSNAVMALQSVLNHYCPQKGSTGYYQQRRLAKVDSLTPVKTAIENIVYRIETNPSYSADPKADQIIKEAEKLVERLGAFEQEDENILKWSEAMDSKTGEPLVKLKLVPINISHLLQGLFANSVIACSATLAVNKGFTFFKMQIGFPSDNVRELVIPSPFDFKNNALVYISAGTMETYYEIQELLLASRGRGFVLFTSYREMREAYDRVDVPYPKLIQQQGISRTQLLDQFREQDNAVLFATKTFWEGIDVQGEDLSLVIIHKIPFENPSDLVFSSKCEQIDKKYGRGKSFFMYSIPDACIKLKQGVGRLIRSEKDKGVIALLDSRVNYKGYGKVVIESLPDTYRTQKLENIHKFFDKIK